LINGALQDPATGRFTVNPNKPAPPQPGDNVHGNSYASTKITYLYRLVDDDGNYLKTGITNNRRWRYTQAFLSNKRMIILTQGNRANIAALERFIIERDPGPLNFDPYAGSMADDVPTMGVP
jgi:hypothetical protein